MSLYTRRPQFESKPDKLDPVYAHKLDELFGGADTEEHWNSRECHDH